MNDCTKVFDVFLFQSKFPILLMEKAELSFSSFSFLTLKEDESKNERNQYDCVSLQFKHLFLQQHNETLYSFKLLYHSVCELHIFCPPVPLSLHHKTTTYNKTQYCMCNRPNVFPFFPSPAIHTPDESRINIKHTASHAGGSGF